MNSKICSVLGLLLVSLLQGGFSEYRMWTDVGGKQLEAEFVRVVDEKVVLLKRDGSELKVSLDSLNTKDRKYAVLQAPPRIEIKVSTDTDRDNKALGDGYYGRGFQIQKEAVQLEVTLAKTSPAPYEAPLVSEVYLIGQSGERDGYVILERTQSKFRFTTENKNQYTYSSGRAKLQQLEAGKQIGVEYKGYLAMVKDRTGQMLAMKCSKLEFEKYAKVILAAQRGDLFDEEFNPVEHGPEGQNHDSIGNRARNKLPGRRF
ncbi:MAG: hypothetical protein K9M54_03930 [Kiritimatiellales bacterium]|nr:hypothetical protein [Kiritimatiellales bacterium]MCF7863991.1 hypothetical protein [Kiritimatiellales bacterium]